MTYDLSLVLFVFFKVFGILIVFFFSCNLIGLFRSKACADAGLLDKNLMRRALIFYTSVAQFLLSLMTNTLPNNQAPTLPLPSTNPEAFSAMPEWYVEDIAEFLLFALP